MMIMLLINVHCYTNSNLLIIFLNISFGLVLRYGCYNCYVNSGRIYNKKTCIILRCHAPWKILWFRDFSCVTIYGSRDLFSNVTDSIIAKHFTHHEEFNYRGSCRKNLIIEGHPRLLLNNHEWIERAINQLQNNFSSWCSSTFTAWWIKITKEIAYLSEFWMVLFWYLSNGKKLPYFLTSW